MDNHAYKSRADSRKGTAGKMMVFIGSKFTIPASNSGREPFSEYFASIFEELYELVIKNKR